MFSYPFVVIIFVMLSAFTSLSASAAALANPTIPESLKQWVPWVLKDHQALKCPFINQTDYSENKNHLCAWPSALTLNANDTGGSFSQSWRVIQDSWVVLPGNRFQWPQNVVANNQPAEVGLYRNQPALFLTPGNYQLKGHFDWQQLPRSLKIPTAYAFVTMSVNNKPIAFPRVVDGTLWLSERQINQTESDAVKMTVHRKLSDGAFLDLETRIGLNVSGKMREVALGKLLPPGFKFKGIDGDLAAFFDAQGILHAKLKPGFWQINVFAWADPTVLKWQRPEKTHLWPEQEIWTFAAQEQFRVGKLSGGKVIDASLADLPENWQNLPSYVLSPTDSFTYTVQHRGKPLQLENRLTLDRTMWLSFDRSQYTFNDTITGSMINGWRLSMAAPYILESGADQDGSVLITTLKDNTLEDTTLEDKAERGIENRYPEVNIKARGFIANGALSNNASPNAMPVTGWNENFESVSLTLNLPPANRLLAVFGADSVSHSWLNSWTIWASFIVLFAALLAGRISSITVGLMTAVFLILTYHETNAPIISIINMLLTIAIAKYQPFTRLQPLVRVYFTLSLFAVVGSLLYFSAMQLRSVIHPQLEDRQTSHQSNNLMAYESYSDALISRSASPMKMASREPEMMQVSGSRSNYKDQLNERYQTDAVVQAGGGIPNWQWHQYDIHWTSPVAKGQAVNLVVLGPIGTGLLKIAGVILAFLWLYSVLRPVIPALIIPPSTNASADKKTTATASLLVLLLSIPVGTEQAHAQSFPDQQLLDALTQRVTEPPVCNPRCASINIIEVTADTSELKLAMQVHVLSDTAIALPKSTFWRAEKITVNGQFQPALLKHQGWIYFPLNKGVHNVSVIGRIAPVAQFQLRFKNHLQRVKVNASDKWDIIGSQQNHLTGETLEFIATVEQQQTLINTRLPASPLVQVTRHLSIDQPWTVNTKVTRIAPTIGSVSVKIPLLKGEHITTAGLTPKQGQVEITIPASQRSVSWRATLDRQPQLTLTANTDGHRIEHWQVLSSPAWHVEFSSGATEDLPVILDNNLNNDNDYTTTSFYPYEGETLTLDIRRPAAVKGHILAIDQVTANLNQGKRTAVFNLDFAYRSTRGGEHIIELPQGYQLKRITSDGRILNLQPDGLKLAIPITPGSHQIKIELRAEQSQSSSISAPTVNLNAPVSNISSSIDLTDARWVLWTQGPTQGPALIYWGELLVFILLALALSGRLTKVSFSPLNTFSWLMLGIGLSLNNWAVLMLVVVWFASLSASQYRPSDGHRRWFNLSQLVLFGLSVVTLITLVTTIPLSLLSSPDMGIVGNHSYGNHLVWFADQSAGQLPAIDVFSIPTLVYKGIMLLWVLWLSFSLLGWIRWAWKTLGSHGYYWRAKAQSAVVEVVEVEKAEEVEEVEQSAEPEPEPESEQNKEQQP
ncbi:MAG: hypothetical protein ACI8WB_000357 [Phenylobacterium sp.]|jgi:hypothetical protein